MKFKNFSLIKQVHFIDGEGGEYRATKNHVEKRYGESWELEYLIPVPQEARRLLEGDE